MRKYLSKRNILIICAILLILVIFGYRHASNNITTHSARSTAYAQSEGDDVSLKANLKIFIKETIFVFRNQELLKQEILNNPLFVVPLEPTQTLKSKNVDEQQWASVYLKQNAHDLFFQKIETTKIKLSNRDYQIDYISTDTFINKLDNYASRMYLHYYDNQLFFITGEGILGSIDLTEQTINDNQFNAYTIASNLSEFTDPNYDDYDNNIRDLFIKDGIIYVSQNIAFNPECYGTILLAGTLNTQKIEFKQIFAPDACDQNHFKNQETKDFLIDYTISGGRMVDYKDGKILLSTGDSQQEAQGDNTHGKIFAIDETTYSRDMISTGHRNPQGLYYNKQDNIIISSEHGPYGGDEVNLNKNPGGDIENFGWPIASYGFEYHYDPETDENIFKTSHQDYGFVEPLHYYTPSIAVSQIIQLPEKFNNIKQKQILLASLTGSATLPLGRKGITHFILNNEYTIEEKNLLYLDGRIRDLIYVETLNVVIGYRESTKSIMIIKH